MKAFGLILSFLSFVFSATQGFSQENAPKEAYGLICTNGLGNKLNKTIGLNPCRFLVEQGRYDLAFQKAEEVIGEQFSLELSEEFMAFAFEVICQLEKKTITKKSPTIFVKPPRYIFWVNRNEKARKMAIMLPDKKEVSENVKAFDSIKFACLALKKLLETSVKNSASKNNLQRLNSIEKVIDYLAEVRTSYISYDVVSPHLYEAHRIAFIAKGIKGIGAVEEELFRAGRLVASGVHHEWLEEVEESVRSQFSEVMRYIKEILNKEEWEHLLVETSLIDSLDPSKPRGKKAWLNRNK